jgi:hypothetical protein
MAGKKADQLEAHGVDVVVGSDHLHGSRILKSEFGEPEGADQMCPASALDSLQHTATIGANRARGERIYAVFAWGTHPA